MIAWCSHLAVFLYIIDILSFVRSTWKSTHDVEHKRRQISSLS